MEISCFHTLYTCNHILYFTYIPMYIIICPHKIYKLNSYHIGRAKLILSINLILFLMRSASVEPPMIWERHGMFYGFVELPQGHGVFLYINMIDFPLSWERLEGPRPNAMGIISLCHQCGMPVSLGGPSNHVGANQPYSSAIEPNRIHLMLELVVTCCTRCPHFECCSQPFRL